MRLVLIWVQTVCKDHKQKYCCYFLLSLARKELSGGPKVCLSDTVHMTKRFVHILTHTSKAKRLRNVTLIIYEVLPKS